MFAIFIQISCLVIVRFILGDIIPDINIIRDSIKWQHEADNNVIAIDFTMLNIVRLINKPMSNYT